MWPPPLQPHGSEATRPWGFFVRSRRDRAAYSQVFKGFATVVGCRKPLSRRRTRLRLFTRPPRSRPVSDPNSRPSLCLTPPGLSRGWLRSFGRNPPGLASVREGNAKTLDCSPAPPLPTRHTFLSYGPTSGDAPYLSVGCSAVAITSSRLHGRRCLSLGRSSKSPRRHCSCAVLRSLSRSPAAPTRWVCQR